MARPISKKNMAAMNKRVNEMLRLELSRIEKWHRRFLDLADLVATWSKDPSTKVGAVIIDTETRYVLAVGYNGFPRGVKDRPEWYEDRNYKYPVVVHAEMNAILSSSAHLGGATLYCNVGIPCPSCAGAIIQAGIKKVVFPFSPLSTAKMMQGGAIVNLTALSNKMFEDADVETVAVN